LQIEEEEIFECREPGESCIASCSREQRKALGRKHPERGGSEQARLGTASWKGQRENKTLLEEGT
jgi:hypothetical protein